ncbi:MAG TPA: 16S rRNA (guanine(527)-N(7))-methyltransferase RsmG [Syntrophobacteria bacterium]|nr:16S rRNA (guanine(527)-N(7))-methyltransferase RsmG [Syntrophobacteria bacterium]
MRTNLEKEGVLALLHETSSEIGVRLNAPQAELFWLYLQELLEWNRTFPLTAVTEPADIVIKHFVDSLSPLPYLKAPTNLLDIGSGAGFPGIPLKIAAPDLHLSLVDTNRRKVSFLKQVVRTLKLREVAVRHGRVEDFPPPDQPFTTIISRAFRRLEPLLDLVSPLLAPGCTLVAMLGLTGIPEHRLFQGLAAAHGLHLSQVVPLELPRARGGRTLVFFRKG